MSKKNNGPRRTFVVELSGEELDVLARSCDPDNLSSEKEKRWLSRAKLVLQTAGMMGENSPSHPQVWFGKTITFITFLMIGDL